MRNAICWFVDGTWYRPQNMAQIMIIMFKDSITKEKIPGLFIVTNNKTEELYTKLFKSIKNILTYNNSVELSVQYIITDNEISLINAIRNIFPNIQRISCFYHYIQNLRKNCSKFKFLNKDYIEETKIVLKQLAAIPFLYKGNMDIFNMLINNIIEEHSEYADYINKYFIINKKKYFEDESYNYCLIPVDCRTNSNIEIYNRYIKTNLGKKKALTWINFINFIKKEALRFEDMNNSNMNSNIKFKSKYSKFSINKYKNNCYNDINIIANKKINSNKFNIINNTNLNTKSLNIYLTKNKWFIWHNNSCRYDSFVTIFYYILNNYLKIFEKDLNMHIKYLLNNMENIQNKINSNEFIDSIWKYMINNNIDILKSKVKNNKLVIEDGGFYKVGYINQIFSIFNNNELFCIRLEKNEICKNCNFKNNSIEYKNLFCRIDQNNIAFNTLKGIILNNIPENNSIKCQNCNLSLNTKSINYNIYNLPKFLFLIFEFDTFYLLKSNRNKILNLLKTEFSYDNDIKYYLAGCITMYCSGHYTSFFINRFNFDNFEIGKLYYHDGLKFSGRFLVFENSEDLFKAIKSLCPYIAIYIKNI